jgi:hypothetical protein
MEAWMMREHNRVGQGRAWVHAFLRLLVSKVKAQQWRCARLCDSVYSGVLLVLTLRALGPSCQVALYNAGNADYEVHGVLTRSRSFGAVGGKCGHGRPPMQRLVALCNFTAQKKHFLGLAEKCNAGSAEARVRCDVPDVDVVDMAKRIARLVSEPADFAAIVLHHLENGVILTLHRCSIKLPV